MRLPFKTTRQFAERLGYFRAETEDVTSNVAPTPIFPEVVEGYIFHFAQPASSVVDTPLSLPFNKHLRDRAGEPFKSHRQAKVKALAQRQRDARLHMSNSEYLFAAVGVSTFQHIRISGRVGEKGLIKMFMLTRTCQSDNTSL